MQVFDFDNTLYKGESSFDFAMYVIQKHKDLLKYMPLAIRLLCKYKFGRLSPEEYVEYLNHSIKKVFDQKDEILSLAKDFWIKNSYKLDFDMIKKIKKCDVIVTACPDFLMDPVKEALHTKHILCTKMNIKECCIEYLNFNDNKVKLYQKEYPYTKIKNFYTDSFNDQPMMDISKHVYLVKNGCCTKIK